jgi:hypothetical protein
VAHIVDGDLVSIRRLSARRERLGSLSAVLVTGLLAFGAMGAAAVVVRVLGRSLYVPSFVAVWGAAALAISVAAISVVRRRLSRYVLGSRLTCDAFAPAEVDLVRRTGERFELTIVPGMVGHVENGRVPLPVEALVADRPRTIVLGEGATAHLSMGSSTFVVRSRPEEAATDPWFSRDLFDLFSSASIFGIQLALVGTLFAVIPSGQTIGDRAAHLVAPKITTPWEAEKWLRIEAQAQARSLHGCFDPLPLSCQHPGYLGVGVSLSRDGEVRSNWIARSTYEGDCAVDQCVKDVVSTWVFDPLPEAMRVILPVQVLRTGKPLPPKVAEANAGASPLAARRSMCAEAVE